MGSEAVATATDAQITRRHPMISDIRLPRAGPDVSPRRGTNIIILMAVLLPSGIKNIADDSRIEDIKGDRHACYSASGDELRCSL